LQLGGMPAGIVIKVDQDEIYSQARVLWWGIMLIMAVGIMVILGTSYFFSTSITKPVLDIRSKMGEAEKGDLTVKPEIKSRDEIGQMSQAFAKMVHGLQESQEKVKKPHLKLIFPLRKLRLLPNNFIPILQARMSQFRI